MQNMKLKTTLQCKSVDPEALSWSRQTACPRQPSRTEQTTVWKAFTLQSAVESESPFEPPHIRATLATLHGGVHARHGSVSAPNAQRRRREAHQSMRFTVRLRMIVTQECGVPTHRESQCRQTHLHTVAALQRR